MSSIRYCGMASQIATRVQPSRVWVGGCPELVARPGLVCYGSFQVVASPRLAVS